MPLVLRTVVGRRLTFAEQDGNLQYLADLVAALTAVVVPTAPDADAIINRLPEVVAFLAGIPEGQTLAALLNATVTDNTPFFSYDAAGNRAFLAPQFGVEVRAAVAAGNGTATPPTATSVTFTPLTTATTGQQFQGNYVYSGATAEAGTTLQVYRTEDGAPTARTAVVGATALPYTAAAGDVGKRLVLGVTPRNAGSAGTEAFSAPTALIVAGGEVGTAVVFPAATFENVVQGSTSNSYLYGPGTVQGRAHTSNWAGIPATHDGWLQASLSANNFGFMILSVEAGNVNEAGINKISLKQQSDNKRVGYRNDGNFIDESFVTEAGPFVLARLVVRGALTWGEVSQDNGATWRIIVSADGVIRKFPRQPGTYMAAIGLNTTGSTVNNLLGYAAAR